MEASWCLRYPVYHGRTKNIKVCKPVSINDRWDRSCCGSAKPFSAPRPQSSPQAQATSDDSNVPGIPSASDIPVRLNKIICSMFREYLLYPNGPNELQSKACYEFLRFDNPARALSVFAGTSIGKSAIAQVIGALLGGITLCLQPNLALQADQSLRQIGCNNTYILNLNIMANDKATASRIHGQLLSLLSKPVHEWPHVFIYISPMKLNDSVTWQKLFIDCAKGGLLNLCIVDESHKFPLDAILFRTDISGLKNPFFDELLKCLNVRFLCLSATMDHFVIDLLKNKLGIHLDRVVWKSAAEMAKYNFKISWMFRPRGTFTTSWKKRIQQIIHDYDDMKVILYTQAESRVAKMVCHTNDCFEKAMEMMDHKLYCAEITGKRSSTSKFVEMGLFSGWLDSDLSRRCRALVGQSDSSDHGIDYSKIPFIGYDGLPQNPYSFFQIIGRLWRCPIEEILKLGEVPTVLFGYDLSGYYYLLVRAHETETPEGRVLAHRLLGESVSLFLSNKCVHHTLAARYGRPNSANVLPHSCGGNCFVCDGSYKSDILLDWNMKKLKDLLFECFCTGSSGPVTLQDFPALLWKNKKKCVDVFDGNDKTKFYHVEALAWHLVMFRVLKTVAKCQKDKDDNEVVIVYVCPPSSREFYQNDDNAENDPLWQNFIAHRSGLVVGQDGYFDLSVHP